MIPHAIGATTRLKRAPPLAKLLTSATGPGAAIGSRAQSQRRGAGVGLDQSGNRRHGPTRPQRSAAAHAALPEAPDSPSAPFTDVTTGEAPANTSAMRTRLDGIERAWHSPMRRPRRLSPARARILEREPHRPRERLRAIGQAFTGTAALDAATPRIAPRGVRCAASGSSHRPKAPSPMTNPARSASNGASRRENAPPRRHDLEAIVRLVERFEERVDAAGDQRGRAPLAQQIDRTDEGGQARRFLVAHGDVRAAQLELEPGQPGSRIADRAVEQQGRRGGGTAAKERIEKLLRRLATGRPRAEQHAGVVVALGGTMTPASSSASFVAASA